MNKVDFFHPAYDAWVDVAGPAPDEVSVLFPELAWADVKVRAQTLPFYPGAEFLIMRSRNWAPGNLHVYAVTQGDKVCVLNGTSPPIHEFNALGHLKLTDECVLDYLRFFTFFVRGEEGPFYVIDSTSAAYLPQGLRAGTVAEGLVDAQKRLKMRIQSTRLFGRSSEGKWRCSATIYYSNAIFTADFVVQPGGMVEILNDTPALADLPVKIWAPITPQADGSPTLH